MNGYFLYLFFRVLAIFEPKGSNTLEPSCHTIGVNIRVYRANRCQNNAGRNTQQLMLTTILVLPNITKLGISVSVARVTLLEISVHYYNLM